MKNKYVLNFVVAFLCVHQLSAQDKHFSQYTEMSSVINPAVAGVNYDTRVIGSFRTQWSSVATPYQTYGVAFEQAIRHKKLGKSYLAISANIFRDMSGDAKLGKLNPNLGMSVITRIDKRSKLSAGVQGGFMYKTIDVNNLRWDRQFNGYEYDATRLSGENEVPRSSLTSYDIGAGVNYSYAQSEKFISSSDGNKFNAGASVYHFTPIRNSFLSTTDNLAMRYCVYASGDFNIPKSKNAIMPSVIYMRQGPSTEVLVGALFKFILAESSIRTSMKKPSAFSVGAQYRYRDAIIPTILWQYDKYAIGLSYDINVSALTPASQRNGGLEVMLRYNTSPGYGKNLGRGDTRASY